MTDTNSEPKSRKTKETLKIEFDLSNPDELALFDSIKSFAEKFHKPKYGKEISTGEVIKFLLRNPNENDYKKLKKKQIETYSNEDQYKALYDGYCLKENNKVSMYDFNLNILHELKGQKIRNELINIATKLN